MRKFIGPIVCCALISGCMIGPNYKKPVIETPDTYRGIAATTSIAEQQWWEIFQDKKLQALIHTALLQNFDVRIAADHILEAKQQLNITDSYQMPTINAVAGPSGERYEKIRTTNAYAWGSTQIGGTFAWQVDFWGQGRRMIEASKANLLGTQWARQEVINTLIASVAGAYFQLRELDMELEISKNTLISRQESLRLTRQLADHGSASMLDVAQAEQLVYTASENVPDIERRIAQQENLISILLGNNPGAIERGLALTQEPQPPLVPPGIPSLLLERRPDIMQAEQQLIAMNAQIGVAEGDYFPQINLTASGGYQSAALSKLFTGPSGMWDIAAALTQPIFNAGRIHAGVKFAKAQQQEALHQYQKTIQEAFREVSDALAAYTKDHEFTVQQDLLTKAAKDAARLSGLRYKGGSASYLEVLTSETNYYSAQLGDAQARLNELQALVDLYQALGGGWQENASST